MAEEPEQPQITPVWVSGIPGDWNEAAVGVAFSRFGAIHHIDIPASRLGRRPFAYVHFADAESAQKACAETDQIIARGRPISVALATAKKMDPLPRSPDQRPPSPASGADMRRIPYDRRRDPSPPPYDRIDDPRRPYPYSPDHRGPPRSDGYPVPPPISPGRRVGVDEPSPGRRGQKDTRPPPPWSTVGPPPDRFSDRRGY
jgi:RNA recognition motif-containing protein